MAEKIQQIIEELNTQLGEDYPYRFAIVNPRDIRLLDRNARYMSNEMFMNLVDNVRRDKSLSSLPLCYQEEYGLLVLSGNHRVQAALTAGLPEIMVLVINKELSEQEKIAVQLSHNAIEGRDDPAILKELWEKIADLDLKIYAGLDSETIKTLETMEFTSIAEARVDFKMMTFLFLPEEETTLQAAIKHVENSLAGDSIFLMSRNHYKELFEAIVTIKERFDIYNNPTAIMKIVEIAMTAMQGMCATKDIDK